MGASSFNEMELDAIGEIMNISLGASATAVSTMLGTLVNITTPVVSVLTRDEFEFRRMEPAIGVEIAYVEGLDGKNIMMFRREDVGVIVGTLLGEDPMNTDFEMDEIHISAICEVMNQMMGSSATALSEFLNKVVNISTPISFEVKDEQEFIDKTTYEKVMKSRVVTIRGFTKKINFGSLKKAGFGNPSIVKEVIYYKEVVDGVTVFEVDKINGTPFVINGENMAAETDSMI